MTIEQLQAEAKNSRCGERLSACDEIHRQGVFSTLEHERLLRKYGDILKIYEGEDGKYNWNQVFYLLFMRTMGDEANRDVFMEVARRLPLKYILRERNTPMRVEAMFLYAAGFIGHYANYDYIEPLKRDAEYLAHKYDIQPLTINHWNLGRIRPVNHPVVRLSQVAMLLCTHEFMFDDMIRCKERRDIDKLFVVKSTDHFIATHPYLMREGQESITLGASKRVLLGINLVVPMQFAYGYFSHDDDLCAQAQDLNESLPAEMNRYIRRWREQGLNPTTSFETQALIQLTTKYCKEAKCNECPVARLIVADVI
ncbi:MAG: DUF2851 family protein [Rikenellaceae bacterium]